MDHHTKGDSTSRENSDLAYWLYFYKNPIAHNTRSISLSPTLPGLSSLIFTMKHRIYFLVPGNVTEIFQNTAEFEFCPNQFSM